MTFSDSFAIERFRELLKVDTISHSGVSSGSYSRIAEIIQLQCIDAGLTVQTVELVKGKPLVIATKLGSNPSLSSLLLSGHYDVVPVDFEKWTVPPFDALVKDGKIYGRGTQDMKCCLAAYIESMKRLIANSFSSERSIHLLFLPDEEIGGWDGMGLFVQTDLFKSLNVGFALDEGLASATSQVPVYFGWIKVKTKGVTGHASKYLGYGALDKLHKSCDRALEFRQQEADKFNAGTPIGDIVTLNITSLKMGKTMDNGSTYALNVIPSDAEAGFDIRIPPSMDLEKFETDLVTLLTNNDPDIEFERITGITKNVSTSIDPEKNKWWAKFKQVCLELGIDIVPQVFPAATDSRYLRILGIPCLGFSPLRNTPVKFHDHDEYLECSVYLASIPIYMEMIKNLVELIE